MTPMAISARPAAAAAQAQQKLATVGSMSPRINLAAVAARLPEGVRLVTVARGAVVRSMAAPGDESMAGEEDMMYTFLKIQGFNAHSLLNQIDEPLRHIFEKMQELKSKVEKTESAMGMIQLAYEIIDRAYKCCPVVANTSPLPREETFVALCLGRDLEDGDEKRAADMLLGQGMLSCAFDNFDKLWPPSVSESDLKLMKAVIVAMNFATCATARYMFLSYGGTLP